MRLARPTDELPGADGGADAVVIGSGVAGAVASARLARMGLAVIVLERGREIVPGELPASWPDIRRETTLVTADDAVGRADGLYNVRLGGGGNVLSASAVGGGTLLRSGQTAVPDPRVWEDPRWPPEIIADGWLETGFARALSVLRPAAMPGADRLEKLARLDEAARHVGATTSRPPLAIAFTPQTSSAGVAQSACTGCGDCLAGCNVGARTTARETWLADAVRHGARLHAGLAVETVEKAGDGWRVAWRRTDPAAGGAAPASIAGSVIAPLVVVAAGALGTTEIIARSRRHGLAVSTRLGEGVSLNGAGSAVGWRGQKPAAAIGIGAPPVVVADAPGPSGAGSVTIGAPGRLTAVTMVSEVTLPSALAEVLPMALRAAADDTGHQTSRGMLDSFQEAVASRDATQLGPWAGALLATQAWYTSGHDAADARLLLDAAHAVIAAPGSVQSDLQRPSNVAQALLGMATANDATFIADPLAGSPLAGRPLVTAPLGGASMGRDRSTGVVDHAGRLFDAAAADPAAVHDGLLLIDAATIPCALGVSPMLAIAALAERAMALLAGRLGRQLAADAPFPAAVTGRKAEVERPTAVIHERFEGWLSDRAGTDHAAAAAVGRNDGNIATLTLATEDAPAAPENGDTRLGVVRGVLRAPDVAAEPLPFAGPLERAPAPDGSGTVLRGSATAEAPDGRRLAITLGRTPPAAGTPASRETGTTTLAVDIAEERGGSGRHWRGELVTPWPAEARALAAIEAVGGAVVDERLASVRRLGTLLAGPLYTLHGAVAPTGRASTGPPTLRRRRGLRAGIATLHRVETVDGVHLGLTRFDRDGECRKGPLLLVPGLATTSGVFTLDTVDTSLVEFMADRGWDCWVLDTRANVDGPGGATGPCDLDAIARHDIRAAVAAMRRITGATSIDVVAHCIGAVPVSMAVLAGHVPGVRSAVLLQAGPDLAGSRRPHVVALLRAARLI